MKAVSLPVRLQLAFGIVLGLAALTLFAPRAQAAACTAPSTDYGSATTTVSIPATGTYRIWTRMAAANASNNTYLLEVDNNTCYNVGGSGVPVYGSGSTTRFVNNSTNWRSTTSTGTQIDMNLTAGSHTIKMIGNAPDVVIDRIVFTQDTGCTPTGTGDNCANPPDTTPPVVSITSPTNGATNVTSPVNINVNATDDTAVTRVEVYVDGSGTAAKDSSTSPFTITGVALTPGSHTLRVRAYDAAGNNAYSSNITITVRDSTNPTVSLTAPTNGSTISGTVAMTATASDNVGVNRVEFLVDGQVRDTDTTSPYSTSLDTTGLSNGSHTLAARAYDDAGNNTTSSATVTVNNTSGGTDTTAPSVSIANPTANAIIAGKPYQVSVTATDASGIQQVVFQVDGATVFTDTTAPYTYDLDTTALTNGSHTIRVRATDNSTAHNVSSYVSVTVRITDIADTNRNCTVNFSDISAIVPRLGTTGTGLGVWDVNNDNKINFSDISAIVPRLGTTPCTP